MCCDAVYVSFRGKKQDEFSPCHGALVKTENFSATISLLTRLNIGIRINPIKANISSIKLLPFFCIFPSFTQHTARKREYAESDMSCDGCEGDAAAVNVLCIADESVGRVWGELSTHSHFYDAEASFLFVQFSVSLS